jgi:hypothetical protein
MHPILAAVSQTKEEAFFYLLCWLGGMVLGVILLLVLLLTVIKRRMVGNSSDAGSLMELGRLRELRESGGITQEEYEQLRSQLIGGAAPSNRGAQPPAQPDNEVQSPPGD